jgi:RimJ/RimL family protein N-acetyltransferase
MDSAESFTATFGVPPADGMGEFLASGEVSADFRARLDAQRDAPADPWSLGFARVHGGRRLVAGMAGFKGPPGEDGVVEITYGVAPSFQNQGLATEPTRALLAFADADPRVRLVLAHTLRGPTASARVPARCGFTCRGEVEDLEDGVVWRWELSPQRL